MTTREELVIRVKLVEELDKPDSSPEIKNAVKRAQASLTDFDNALQAKNITDADRIAKEIIGLSESVLSFAAPDLSVKPPSRAQRIWPYVGMGVLAVVFLGLAAFVVYYVGRTGSVTLSTIEGTRPILVIAAILSTITFGGALIVAPLFSSEGAFDLRFRRAREIFLVFSGVFGTVMGFYFGAGDSQTEKLNVAAMLEGSTVVAYATGGTSPYSISVTYGPQKQTKSGDTTNGWVSFTFDKETDNIIPLTVSATDSKGLQGKAMLKLDEKELKNLDWKLGSGGSESQGAGSDPTEGQTETNSQSANGTPEN